MSTKTQAFIDKVLQIVATRDPSRVDELVGESITFHTPRYLKPHTDRQAVKLVLTGVIRIVEDFRYDRTWATEHEAIMEFRGRIGKWVIHGLDIFTVGDDGRATELTVFVRPPKGLEALGEAEDRMLASLGLVAPAPAAP